MNNTPTPRTDAAAWPETDLVEGNFARQLESELAAVTEQRDGLRSGIDYASDQLTRVTEQRDRLAEALDNTLKHMTHSLNCNTRIAESLSCNCRMERDYDNATKALQHIIQPSEFESYKNINLNKWKPIETAPKDGTRIIGCDGLNYYVCSWGEESLVGSESENHGWVTDYDDDGMCFNLESPTHWIPIVPFQKLLQSLNQPTQ